jgi:hypothetical protein
MNKVITILMVTFFVLAFNSMTFAATQGVGSSEPSAGAVLSDILVLRPLGFAGTILGGGAFLVSLPVTLAAHRVDNVGKALVETPFNYTFERPLGNM